MHAEKRFGIASKGHRRSGLKRAGHLALLGVAVTTVAAPAQAGLGGRVDSIEADRAHAAAGMERSARANYTMHVLTLPNGGVTREFVGKEGVVFAISWRGPSRPDLRQLLGDRFETLQADNVHARRRLRAPMVVNRSDFVLHSSGHPGAFWGMAYLPQATPADFSANDMR